MADIGYSRLSNIVTVPDLPEQLHFIENGIDNLLQGIFYQKYTISGSHDGVSTHLRIELVLPNGVALTLPGTAFRLLLNPTYTRGVGIVPISISTKLGIRKYFKSFKLTSFEFSPAAFVDLLKSIVPLEEGEIFVFVPIYFIEGEDVVSN